MQGRCLDAQRRLPGDFIFLPGHRQVRLSIEHCGGMEEQERKGMAFPMNSKALLLLLLLLLLLTKHIYTNTKVPIHYQTNQAAWAAAFNL